MTCCWSRERSVGQRAVGQVVDAPALTGSTAAGRRCAGTAACQAVDPQHVDRFGALQVALNEANGDSPMPVLGSGAVRGNRPAVPTPVTDPATTSAMTVASAASATPLTTWARPAPAPSRRPVSPLATSRIAYSMAGAAKASHGSIARSMDAGTENTQSNGRATRAGARQTAIRMSTISAVAPTDRQIRKDSSVEAGPARPSSGSGPRRRSAVRRLRR